MRNYPEYESEFKELNQLNAQDWMIELLKKNPDYTGWGSFDDYMRGNYGDEWLKPIILDSVSQLKPLDENNEVVNFYFELTRENHECEHCKGTGYNEKTKELSDAWYSYNSWQNNLTQDEVDMLWEKGRLNLYFTEKPTAQQLNELSKKTFVHDCINQYLCLETRAKRLGIYGDCPKCNDGYVYDEPNAKVSLQLWVIHPENGASQGVYVKTVKKEEVDTVIEYLKEAGKRLFDKFSKLDKETSSNWVKNLLEKNNTITSWGNGCEYMLYELGGWNEPILLDSVDELWKLNDLNELVDFYFENDNEEYGLSLQMWIIHPRKGASRGVALRNIKEKDVDIIIDYLNGAKERNSMRFEKL